MPGESEKVSPSNLQEEEGGEGGDDDEGRARTQTFLCRFQHAFWHASEQYLAHWHLLHLLSAAPPSPSVFAHSPLSQMAPRRFDSSRSAANSSRGVRRSSAVLRTKQ